MAAKKAKTTKRLKKAKKMAAQKPLSWSWGGSQTSVK
jgi:hypothetical protein